MGSKIRSSGIACRRGSATRQTVYVRDCLCFLYLYNIFVDDSCSFACVFGYYVDVCVFFACYGIHEHAFHKELLVTWAKLSVHIVSSQHCINNCFACSTSVQHSQAKVTPTLFCRVFWFCGLTNFRKRDAATQINRPTTGKRIKQADGTTRWGQSR